MLTFSLSWKEELLEISKRTKEKISSNKDWTPIQSIDFEKDIMLGFYIIRKLIEGNELTNKLISTKIKGTKYPNSSKNVTILNNHRIPELYKFDNPSKQKFSLRFLANQFIHSYIFYPVLCLPEEGRLKFTDLAKDNVSDDEFQFYYSQSKRELDCILFTSDDRKNEFIYELDINKIISLFEDIGNCFVTTIMYQYNEKKGDYDVEQSDERNLEEPF